MPTITNLTRRMSCTKLLIQAWLAKSVRIMVPGRPFLMNRNNPIATADISLKDAAQLLAFAKQAARNRAFRDQVANAFPDAAEYWDSFRELAGRRANAPAALEASDAPTQPNDNRSPAECLARAAPQVAPNATSGSVTTILATGAAVANDVALPRTGTGQPVATAKCPDCQKEGSGRCPRWCTFAPFWSKYQSTNTAKGRSRTVLRAAAVQAFKNMNEVQHAYWANQVDGSKRPPSRPLPQPGQYAGDDDEAIGALERGWGQGGSSGEGAL